MAVWGWSRIGAFALGAEVFDTLTHVKRHLAAIDARPAAERAVALKDRHAFKTEMDAEALRHMFPHLAA
jgi:GST-like protein